MYLYNYNQCFKKPLVMLSLLGMATACEPEIEREALSYEEARGDADFSVFVSLGNSLTAGYADGALNRQGQIWSYPAIIAEQLQYIKPDLSFNQPLLPEGRANGTLYILSFNTDPETGLATTPNILPEIGGLSRQEIYAPVSGTFQNLGVPGAKVGDLTLPGYGSSQGNPYFARFATTPTTTMVEMATVQNPTFFTLWIGNNDVLGYALAGGEGGEITSPADFETRYRAVISELTASNAGLEGALANIPDIEGIPMFSQFPWNGFGPLTQVQASALNAGFEAELRKKVIFAVSANGVAKQYVFEREFQRALEAGQSEAEAMQTAGAYVQSETGQAEIAAIAESIIDQEEESPFYTATIELYTAALAADAEGNLAEVLTPEGAAAVEENQQAQLTQLRGAGFFPNFQEGMNPFVVADESSPSDIRLARESDKILLSGVANPEIFNPLEGKAILPAAYVLDANELTEIRSAIDAYNSIINNVASEYTLALVDIHAFFDQIVSSGITENGTRFTAAFISGNAFSLDGVHLTPKGYALVAQRFIRTINGYYGSAIPEPTLSKYPAVAFPNN